VLFELKQVLANCDFLQQQITDCDVKLEKEMRARPTRPSQPEVGAAAAPLEMRPVGSSVWSGRLMNRDE
jgi:hypothetical protein